MLYWIVYCTEEQEEVEVQTFDTQCNKTFKAFKCSLLRYINHMSQQCIVCGFCASVYAWSPLIPGYLNFCKFTLSNVQIKSEKTLRNCLS